MNFPRNLPVGPENVTAEALRAQRDAQEVGNPAIGPHKEGRWCPDFCPLTLRPFFMWLDHPELGYVPTYGGPFNSYTIPEADYLPGEICRPEDIEWVCYRYDHDRGGWHDGGEDPGIRVLHESRIVQRDEVIADLSRSNATLKAEAGKLRRDSFVPGLWRCKTCHFEQIRFILAVDCGEILANTEILMDPCPNDGDMMFPVTWKEQYELAAERYESQVALPGAGGNDGLLLLEKSLREHFDAAALAGEIGDPEYIKDVISNVIDDYRAADGKAVGRG